MNGVFIDSNIIIFHLAGDENVKRIMKLCEEGEISGYINDVVLSEVIYSFLRVKTGLKASKIKRNPHILEKIDLSYIRDLFEIFSFLEINREISTMIFDIIKEYKLLPNDALIAATCKYYGIKKIATFDEDFKRVDFLEVINPSKL